MHRNLTAFVLLHEGPRLVVGHVTGVALGRDSQINHCLGESQFALRRSQPLERRGGVVGNLHGTRVGQADIFPGHAHDTTGQVTRIGTTVEHARQPVEGGIRIGTPHRLMQG